MNYSGWGDFLAAREVVSREDRDRQAEGKKKEPNSRAKTEYERY